MRALKGVQALHEETNAASASDAVAAALAVIRDEEPLPNGGHYSPDELIALTPPDTEAEQSSLVPPEPPPAPSLYVPGMEAIREAGAATEAERVREYGLLAEIDAKLTENAGEAERIAMVIEATEATLSKARSDGEAKAKVGVDLTTQRAETVDRIVKLNQAAIDHETARLRRG